MTNKVLINPTFRLDVNGKLFRNKNTNNDVQETIIFNALMARLSINKGDLPLFPNVGLKQYFGKLNFMDEVEIAMTINEFEAEIEAQMNKECKITPKFDKERKHVEIFLELEGLEYPIQLRYSNNNGSIRIIEPQLEQ